MAEKVLLGERSHPLYEENLDLWELYYDSTKGGDRFIVEDNLFSHRLEDSTDYEERLDRAYYLNYCEAVPNMFNNYIFKEGIERNPDPNLDIFRKNCNGRGGSIDDLVKVAGFFSKVYGVVHVLVDMPVKTKDRYTLRDVKSGDLSPYCTIIHPTKLKDWSLDANGNFNWVLIESTHYKDLDPGVEREEETHYKLITREEWRIEDADGNTVNFDDERESSGTNDLGIVPMVTLYHRDFEDSKIGESLIKDIVYINRTILNWCSCLDEQIERQTFSQLIVPDDGTLAEESETGDDPLHRIGTSYIWTFNSNAAHPPQFISPDVENIQTVWRITMDHIKEIFRISGLIGSSDDLYASRSGRAAQMGFLGVNSSLAETAKRYQQFENELSKIAYLHLGQDIENYEDVKYPDSFDLTALSEEIDSIFKVLEKNFSETLNKTMIKDVARRAVPLAPQSIREAVETEVESGNGYVEPSSRRLVREDYDMMDAEKDGQGNRNSNMGKTFRDKKKLEDEERTHRREE